MDYKNDLSDIQNAQDEGRLNDIYNRQVKAYADDGNEGVIGKAYGAIVKAQLEKRRTELQQQKAQMEQAHQQQVNALDNRKSNTMNQYLDQARRQLAAGLMETKQNAASRGLLHSGLRQDAEQKQYGQAASGAEDFRSRLNTATDQEMGQLDQEAAGRGLQQYQQQANNAVQDYQNALAKRGQGQSVAGQFGSAVGGIAGGLLGSKI